MRSPLAWRSLSPLSPQDAGSNALYGAANGERRAEVETQFEESWREALRERSN